MKELNVQILLLQIMSGSKIGVTKLNQSIRRYTIELVEGILGLLESKWKSPATSLVTFTLPPTILNMSLSLSSLTNDYSLPCSHIIGGDEGPTNIWSREDRSHHISYHVTCPETTVVQGWDCYPSVYVVCLCLVSVIWHS